MGKMEEVEKEAQACILDGKKMVQQIQKRQKGLEEIE